MTIEDRTARLTILIDPRKKAVFEQLCAEEDVTPSQMVRRLIREYIERKRGVPWKPGDPAGSGASASRRPRRPRG
ncbi:MAG TPA: ribbon-helix-helix protein, CopG family [Myxococcaceae bacterium]|nr:ribbon-helix-helix protein, CopG family [Myxococcaceae bacterium]